MVSDGWRQGGERWAHCHLVSLDVTYGVNVSCYLVTHCHFMSLLVDTNCHLMSLSLLSTFPYSKTTMTSA